MTKAYNRINWQNEPSTDTALNEQNLNKMDRAIDVIDDRVCGMEESVQAKVDEAGEKVDDAEAQAKLAESWAKGDTGSRQGENTNNSKYYSLQAKAEADRAKQYAENAEAVTGVEIATTAKAGLVKPDGTSITVDPDGTMHAAGGGGGAAEWDNIENKPETFPPSAHQHVIADITDLNKASTSNLGLVKVDGTSIVIDENGVISSVGGGSAPSSLAKAEMEVLGWNVPSASPIQNELDGNNFIQRVGRIDLSTLTWEEPPSTYPHLFLNRSFPGVTYTYSDLAPIYCEKYINVPWAGDVSITDTDKSISSYNAPPKIVAINDSAYSTVNQLMAGVSGVYLYYLLEEPITTLMSDNAIGEAYSSTKSYSAGDYAIYNDKLYKCKVACVGQTPTNTTYWMATSVANELKTKNIVTTVAPTAGATSTYPVGTTIDVIE